jgi:hypothetical protein
MDRVLVQMDRPDAIPVFGHGLGWAANNLESFFGGRVLVGEMKGLVKTLKNESDVLTSGEGFLRAGGVIDAINATARPETGLEEGRQTLYGGGRLRPRRLHGR